MKKKIRFILAAQSVSLFIIGCNLINYEHINEWGIVIKSKFLEEKFNIKKVSSKTIKISLEISDIENKTPLKFILTPEDPIINIHMTTGLKNISATAFDISNKILTNVKGTFSVYNNNNNKLDIILRENLISDNVSNDIVVNCSIIQTNTDKPAINVLPSNLSVPSSSPTINIPTPNPSVSSSNYSSGTNSNSSGSNNIPNKPQLGINVNLVVSSPIPSVILVK